MKKEYIKTLDKLVSIKSVTDSYKNTNAVINYIQSELSDYLVCKKYRCDGYPALLCGSNKDLLWKPKVTIHCHVDVVPGKNSLFTLQKDGDSLKGRGVYDMKGATAVIISLAKFLASRSLPVSYLFVTDEETGGFKGSKFFSDNGYKTDFVITGEPSNMDISYGTRGVLTFKITQKGVSAHSAYSYEGRNAIVDLTKIISKISKAYPIKKSVSSTSANIAQIFCPNSVSNSVPDYAEAVIDIRSFEGNDSILKKISIFGNRYTEFEVIENEPFIITNKNDSNTRKLQKLSKKYGYKGDLIKKRGSSDLRHFLNTADAGVEFGPVGGLHHSDDEWVSEKSLEDYFKILKEFLVGI